MNTNAELLVVERDDVLQEHIVVLSSDRGYRISADRRQETEAVLAFDSDAVAGC